MPETGFTMLDVSTKIMGQARRVHPTLIWDRDTVLLIDTGFPGQLPEIRQAMEMGAVPFEMLNQVVLTHQDIDHIGNVAPIRALRGPQLKVFAHTLEKPYIEGEKQPLKLAQLEATLDQSPAEGRATYEKLRAAFQAARAHVDSTLNDGDELPYLGGIMVIHTPGHTLGHICLYVTDSKTLIAGDALEVEDGRLVMAPPSANYDMALCRQSLKKLSNYEITSVICYHGGLYLDDPNERIASLAAEAGRESR